MLRGGAFSCCIVVLAVLASSIAGADPVVLASQPRVIERATDETIGVRRSGQKDVLALMTARKDAKVTATAVPFLRSHQLLDVTIAQDAGAGWAYSRSETHFVLDVSGRQDVVVCRFDGDSSNGTEYRSSSTTIAITVARPARAGQVAFDVKRTTVSRTPKVNPNGVSDIGSPPVETSSSAVERFELGASSCTGTPTPPSPPRATR